MSTIAGEMFKYAIEDAVKRQNEINQKLEQVNKDADVKLLVGEQLDLLKQLNEFYNRVY